MTLAIGFTSATLLAVWLILMGVQQLGVAYPRWLVIVMGIVAILAGLLFLIGR
jgi:hypothetical protein